MNMVAIGRVVLITREHIIALEPLDKGLIGTMLRYPCEVRNEAEYFDEIDDVTITKDMLDLAKHIVNSKSGQFEPEKFEDHYETALIDLVNKKRNGQSITPKARPAVGNVVNLMDALRASIGQEQASKPAKKPKKAAGQKEMLLPIDGKKPAKEAAAEKSAPRGQRRSAWRRRWTTLKRATPGTLIGCSRLLKNKTCTRNNPREEMKWHSATTEISATKTIPAEAKTKTTSGT
jgi:DNA end-binding protein Ku